MTRCEFCNTPARLRKDRTGQRVCDGCYVPFRHALPTGTATEDVMVAPPNAKNVTPRMLVG